MELNLLIYISISLALTLLSSKLMKVIKLPNVTGYLLVGLLAGPYVLNIIPRGTVESLGIIPDVALGFIAFSIGAEFRFSYLKKVGKAPIIIACLESLGAVLVVDFILIITGNDVPFSLCLGAIAAATAPAATLMVVKQYKAHGPVTETLGGVGDSLVMTIVNPLLEIIAALAIGVIFGVIFRFAVKWFTGRGNRLAITYALVFACIGLGEMFNISSLLACMALGATLANTSNFADVVFEQTDRMTPPVFMMFFFLSGASLDISIIPSVGVIGILYIIFRILGKMLGSFVGAKISKADKKVQKYLGFTLIPQAGVAIRLATPVMYIVPDYGPKIRTIILCGTVIYELTGPVITKLALKKAGEID